MIFILENLYYNEFFFDSDNWIEKDTFQFNLIKVKDYFTLLSVTCQKLLKQLDFVPTWIEALIVLAYTETHRQTDRLATSKSVVVTSQDKTNGLQKSVGS